MNKRSSGFTLVELLVVISIIALLISITLPALSGARFKARVTVCGSNFHQAVVAIANYASDHNSYFPRHDIPAAIGRNPWALATTGLREMVRYGYRAPVWQCPASTGANPTGTPVSLKGLTDEQAIALLAWPSNPNWVDFIQSYWVPRKDSSGNSIPNYGWSTASPPAIISAFNAFPTSTGHPMADRRPVFTDLLYTTASAGAFGDPTKGIGGHNVNGKVVSINAAFPDGRVMLESVPAQVTAVGNGPWWNWY